jgi:hypothetical protein
MLNEVWPITKPVNKMTLANKKTKIINTSLGVSVPQTFDDKNTIKINRGAP